MSMEWPAVSKPQCCRVPKTDVQNQVKGENLPRRPFSPPSRSATNSSKSNLSQKASGEAARAAVLNRRLAMVATAESSVGSDRDRSVS